MMLWAVGYMAFAGVGFMIRDWRPLMIAITAPELLLYIIYYWSDSFRNKPVTEILFVSHLLYMYYLFVRIMRRPYIPHSLKFAKHAMIYKPKKGNCHDSDKLNVSVKFKMVMLI
jgi:hypothetical protein